MTPVQEFQKKHGATFAKIVANPAFKEAMLVLNLEKMEKITGLTPDEIRANGPEILAELIGHLKHEESLMALHQRRTFDSTDLPPETYGGDEETPPPAGTKKHKTKKED